MGLVHHKIKKYYDQSQYVYESKQNRDKMPGERLDIYIKVPRFLQKKSGLGGMVCGKLRFRGCWGRNLPLIFG